MLKLFTQHMRAVTQSALKRQIGATTANLSTKETPDQLIDISKALQGWVIKLREAGVGDIDFNLKCLVAHVLKRKFVSLVMKIVK